MSAPTGPPRYPLSREAFRRALRIGHGRAWLHVERHGAVEVCDEILGAATEPVVYPAPERAGWLAKFCARAGIAKSVVAAPMPKGHWAASQRCDLLKELASHDHVGARRALHAACTPGEGDTGVLVAGDAGALVVELDGADGLEIVARAIGRRLHADHDLYVSTMPTERFDELHGAGGARRLLEAIAASDADVAAYLAALDRPSAPTSLHVRDRQSVDEVIHAIQQSSGELRWLPKWSRGASIAELAQVVRLTRPGAPVPVLVETLRCAAHAPATEHLAAPPDWFDLLRHEEPEVRGWCADALGSIVDERVREAGLAALTVQPSLGILVLRRNARVIDADAIAAALTSHSDDCDDHEIWKALIELLERTAVRDPRIALHVYEHAECSHCREDVLTHLLDWNACPSWVSEEARHDAAPDIRELFADPLARRAD